MKARIFNIQKFCLHDGPGIRTSVFFSGCPLKCGWCANPECRLDLEAEECKEYEAGELLEEVLKDKAFYDKSGGGVTLTGGEIFCQTEFVTSFCSLLKENQIHIAIETSGMVSPDVFSRMVSAVDFVYIDCKHYDSEKHRQGTGAENQCILQNIKRLTNSGKDYCVRIPVIPGFNDAQEDAQAFCRLFQQLGVQNVELLPFHQLGENKYHKYHLPYSYQGVRQLHKEDLSCYFQVFQEHQLNVTLK